MKKWILCVGCAIGVILGITLIFLAVTARMNKKAIEEVLTQDQWHGYKTIKEKYEYMSRIKLTKCPVDFRKKYIAHVKAWGELALVESDAQIFRDNYTSWSAYLEAFVRGMLFDTGFIGEAKTAQAKLKDHYFRTLGIVKDTWHDVLTCATEYGVDTSKYL